MSPGWMADKSSSVLTGFDINRCAPPLAEPFSCDDDLTGRTRTIMTARAALMSHLSVKFVVFIFLTFRSWFVFRAFIACSIYGGRVETRLHDNCVIGASFCMPVGGHRSRRGMSTRVGKGQFWGRRSERWREGNGVKTLRKLNLWILCSLAAGSGAVMADEAMLFDTFYLGPRPRGNRGELREVFANTSLDGFWAQFPGTNAIRWMAGDGHDFGWQFSGSSIDPNEPREDAFGGNGTITARGRPAALVPFTPPGGPFAVAANLLPLNLPGNWVAVGFTSSGVLSNNFENFAQIWLRLYGNGDYEVRTSGTNGQVVSGRVPVPGFTPVKLVYNPVSRRVSGFVNEKRFADFTNASLANIRFLGLEADTGHPKYFAHANYFRVTRLTEPSVEPRLVIQRAEIGQVITWPAGANSFVIQHTPSLRAFGPWTNLWTTNVIDGLITVTNQFKGQSGFFRLREL